MTRVPKSPMLLLQILSAADVAPLAHSGTGQAGIVFKGPIFQDIFREDHDPVVCKHTLQVFNEKFPHPWGAPELTNSAYLPDSEIRLYSTEHGVSLLPMGDNRCRQ
jgi:hypothetical protein